MFPTPRGNRQNWLQANFKLSQNTATNFMRIGKFHCGKSGSRQARTNNFPVNTGRVKTLNLRTSATSDIHPKA